MSVTKQRSSAGKSVAIFFIVFLILEGLIIFGVSRVFKNKDVTPSIAGYSMYIMDTDAMGDAVPKGALVFAANGSPSVEGVKKAVLAEEVPGIGTSVFWLADVSASADLNGVVYTVFQENNPTKLYKLSTKNIVGTATTYYETAGKVITFMTSKFGMIVLLAVPLFIFVLLELIIMIVNHARYAEDDDEDEYDEDNEDEDTVKEKPVKLDDFLFGGEHDKELIKDRVHNAEETGKNDIDFDSIAPPPRKHRKEITDEDIDLSRKAPAEAEPEAPAEEPAPEAPKAEDDVEFIEIPEAVEEKSASDIHPSYYEKAAKIIDGKEDAPAPAKTEKAEKPKPKPDMKNVSSSFEDLMKLMEAESDKLRNQLNNK